MCLYGTEVVALALGFRHLLLLLEDTSGLKGPAYHVLTSEKDVGRIYGKLVTKPRVRFESSLLIAAHRGLCPTGGYGIVIESLRLAGHELLVNMRTIDPAPEDFVTLIPTYPSDSVALWRGSLGRPGAYEAVFVDGGTKVAVVPFVV